MVLEQELLLEPMDERAPLRAAFHAPASERTTEQKELLASRANIGRITEGSLYLYDRRKETRTRNLLARKEALTNAGAESGPTQTGPQTGQTAWGTSEEIEAERRRIDEAVEQIKTYAIRKELQSMADDVAKIRAEIPVEQYVRPLTEPAADQLPATMVFHRGDHQQPRDAVKPSGLSVLDVPYQADSAESRKTSGRRLGFAEHLLHRDHPLVARTIVNRLWSHHFGRGLAETIGELGRLGQPPTHPLLLDFLAAELMDSGWSIKRLQRHILTSDVYRQSVNADPRRVEQDPENRWYSRWTARRLEAEAVRDSVLAMAGVLNPQMFGEPVPVMEDEVGQIVIGKENLDGERKPTKAISLNGGEFRRSVYVQVRRSRPLSVMESFDLAETSPHCPQRASSNVTPQSLMLMNSNFIVTSSQRFAQRLRSQRDDLAGQLELAWRLAYGVPLPADQRQPLAAFVKQQAQTLDDEQALATLCQALFSSSQFLYIE